MRRMLQYTLFYFIVFLLAFGLSSFGLNKPVVLGVALVVVILFACRPIYTLYYSRDIRRIERYVKSNQHNPLFKYTYAVAHGTKEDELKAIDEILVKYKQPIIQHTYLLARALLEKNLLAAAEEAQSIPKKSFRNYSLAYVEALKGNAAGARNIKQQKLWMEYSIDAIIAYEAKEMKAFAKSVEQTLATARGLQYFQLILIFDKMKAELQIANVSPKKMYS